jgi:hypothetical protein
MDGIDIHSPGVNLNTIALRDRKLSGLSSLVQPWGRVNIEIRNSICYYGFNAMRISMTADV